MNICGFITVFSISGVCNRNTLRSRVKWTLLSNTLVSLSSQNQLNLHRFMKYEYVSNHVSDPTYMIRAIPANASDNVYSTLLAQSAVHGAMAGYTGFVSGLVNGRHTYIPLNVSFSLNIYPCHWINNPTSFNPFFFCLLWAANNGKTKQSCNYRQNVGADAIIHEPA